MFSFFFCFTKDYSIFLLIFREAISKYFYFHFEENLLDQGRLFLGFPKRNILQ